MAYSVVELSTSIDRKHFTSQSEELNEYFQKFATQDHKRNLAKCYVLVSNKEVVGYYTNYTKDLSVTEKRYSIHCQKFLMHLNSFVRRSGNLLALGEGQIVMAKKSVVLKGGWSLS